MGGGITNTASFTTLTLAGKGTLTNLLYSADPNSMTNTLSVTSNANWTLVDNAGSTPITVPWQLDVVGGTLNFGTASSAPNLTSTTVNGVPQDTRVGNVAGAVATFNMVNGIFTTASRLNTGTAAGATGVVNQVSGTLNIRQQFQGANGAATAGSAVNLSGGTMNIDTAATGQFYVASRGPGSLTVSGSGVLNCGTLDVSRSINSSIPGVVNLNGGTLAPTRVGTATGSTATFNFNGGTLKARASSATFFQGSTAAPAVPITTIVKSGGAVIDSDTNAISILEPLQHDSSLGATLDGGLNKLGPGTLTLTAANTFTGPTRVNAGTLAINGSLAAGVAVTVNSGGTLGGTGTCAGTVTVASGGTLAPGNSIGTLTVSSNVFLQAGSTTFMEINRGPALTNDVLRCTGGTINLGGALIVTNIGPALQSGDAFTLFNGTLTGTISVSPASLPLLAPGLGWDSSSLNSLGRIRVTGTTAPPSITGVSVAGGFFTITGSGGQAGAAYRVVASTNAALALSSWTPVATNTFDASGKINISIPISPSVSRDFYRVVVP
jgi:autotransporter-associated beta strand protein